ncbi:MAG TPA: RusA family crossover junction endodeoxyribonuclease, partial [Bacteroidetes bacterium]|nr:RusA family crossover junction endodeoxyribonuclease [Bacteroidota bacterium]
KYLKRQIVVYTAQYNAWKNDALKQLLGSKNKLKINFPVILNCQFYCKTRHRKDLSAFYEGIQDVLVEANVLEDDNSNIIVGHDGSRIHYDKEQPRIEIKILKVK